MTGIIYIIGILKYLANILLNRLFADKSFYFNQTILTAFYGLLWLNYSVEEDVETCQQAELWHTFVIWHERHVEQIHSGPLDKIISFTQF